MHQPDTCLKLMHVMVVEDEPTCRHAVRIFLERAGAAVSPAASAEEALQLFKSRAFDAIITDIRLDGMDGIELLKNVRAQGSDIPVIVMTGHASMQSAISALKLGADDYLLKPITNAGSIVRATRNAIDRMNLRTQNAVLSSQLHESELSFRAIFDQTEDMILTFTLKPDGTPSRLDQCNAMAISTLGYSDKALRQMTVLDLLARSHRDAALRALAGPDRQPQAIDTMLVTAAGAQLPAELHCHRLASNDQIRVIVIARNAAARIDTETHFANALEAERSQLGRELHDVVCQDLASIHMLASPEPKGNDMEHIRSAAASAMDSARSLSKGLLPVFHDSEDFRTAVEELLRTHKERHGIDYSFNMDCTPVTSGENGMLHVFRIVQEATNNTVKHAQASMIEVSMNLENGVQALTVSDNGSGPSSGASGMGTLIMNQRARIVGASLSISDNGNGTTVKCCWQNGDYAEV